MEQEFRTPSGSNLLSPTPTSTNSAPITSSATLNTIHSKLWDSYFLLLIQIWLDVLFGVCLLQLLSAGLIFMLRLCLVTNQLDSLMVKIIETSADDYGLKHRAETAVPRAYFGNSRIPSLGLPSLKTDCDDAPPTDSTL